jgi:RNA polymerase sigma-70 factor (ECF subfamily)
MVANRTKATPSEKGMPLTVQEQAGLVARAKRGDEAAISQLYRQYAPGIYGYVASRVREPAVADDLTSEVFLCALEGLPGFEYRGISLSAWLYRIAHDRMVDHFRRQARRPTLPLDEKLLPACPADRSHQEIEQEVDVRLKIQQVEGAMEKLTAGQHQVILLRFMSGLKLQEIAYVMDKSTDAVKMLQLRALTRLKSLVAQTG